MLIILCIVEMYIEQCCQARRVMCGEVITRLVPFIGFAFNDISSTVQVSHSQPLQF
jgi:hypothetical protein